MAAAASTTTTGEVDVVLVAVGVAVVPNIAVVGQHQERRRCFVVLRAIFRKCRRRHDVRLWMKTKMMVISFNPFFF